MAENGRVTLRDIMSLQKEMYEKLDEINDEITGIKIKVAMISGTIALIVSLVLHLVKGAM